MKHLIVLAPVLLLTACNIVPRLDVMPGYGQFDVDGDVGVTSVGSPARQSLDDIGVDDDESGLAGRADLNWLGFQLSVSGFEADYSGRGTLTAPISSGGGGIGIGADVDTDLELAILNAALTFDLIPGDTLDLGIGVGGMALDVDLNVREVATGITVSADEVLPVPEVVARAAVRFWRLGVYGQVGWIEGEYGDFDGRLLDADVYGQLQLFGSGERLAGHLVLGYRYLDLDFDYDGGAGADATADIEVTGPYLGLMLSL